MFKLTQSLVERQSLAIEPLRSFPSFGGQKVRDETSGASRFYPKYGPALSFAAIPGYVLGRTLAPFAREKEKDVFEARIYPELIEPGAPAEFSFDGVRRFRAVWYDESRRNFPEAIAAFGASLTNAWIVAAVLGLLYLIARQLGCIRPHAAALAVVAGLATPLWPYSKTFFAEPLGALGVTAFLLAALKGRRPEAAMGWWTLAGAAMGLAFLAKPAHVVLVLPASVLLMLYARKAGLRRSLPALCGFALAVAMCAGLFSLYNFVRFGALLETGYGSEASRFTGSYVDGVLGLLVSPGRGLFVYSPLLLLSLAGAWRFGKEHPREAVFALASVITLLALYGRWYGWDGGWCWGPRFLLPVLPVLLLPALSVLFPLPANPAARLGVLGTVVLSTAIALSGTFVHFIDFGQWQKLVWVVKRDQFTAQGVTDFLPVVRWDPLYSAALRYWDFPVKDYYVLPKSVARPGVLSGVFGLALAGLGWGLRRLWGERRGEPDTKAAE